MTDEHSPDQVALVLTEELRVVRRWGRDVAAVEEVLADIPHLAELPVVQQRAHEPRTSTAVARAVIDCVWEAAARLRLDGDDRRARMLFGLTDEADDMKPEELRRMAAKDAGVELRQFRAKQEPELLRLVAQQILELQADEDRLSGARRMMVGAEVPQSVGMYWLNLFRDHYFRMEKSAYAFQVDTMTSLQKRRDEMADWVKFAGLALWWNVEFSFYRDRFFKLHGPMWFTPTEDGSALNIHAENIEYHDAFPEEYMSRLRLILSRAAEPVQSLFDEGLRSAGEYDFAQKKFQNWLALCTCDLGEPDTERCEVHILLRNCELFGEVVEQEFELIQNWYRTARYAVDEHIRDKIRAFRSPATERPGEE